jgi:UDP-N-acetylmuramoylalanine--D-glutamate ligase
VLEVSSFQLDTMATFHPQVAVLLNIAQDHMDRYPDFEAYCTSKSRILTNQTAEDTAVVNGADPRIAEICGQAPVDVKIFAHGDEPNLFHAPLAARIAPERIELDTELARDVRLDLKGTPLLGRHNRENIAAAALATLAAGGSLEGIRQALFRFKVPPHRMEKVAVINGVHSLMTPRPPTPMPSNKPWPPLSNLWC